MKCLLLVWILMGSTDAFPSPMVREGLQNVEEALADEIVHAYQDKDFPKLKRVTGLLLKAFPQSKYGSHALYWMARFLIEDNRIEEGVFVLDRLENHYPTSERAKLIPLMKTVAYGKKGDWDKAKEVFRQSRDVPKGIRR